MWSIMAAPLLISANVRNMSAFNLATYKNKEVIAVNQDVLGKQGVRIMGGPLRGGGRDGNQHPSLVPCDASDPGQQWTTGPSASGQRACANGMHTFQNKATKQLFNSDNCGSGLIMYPWVTGGCHNNQGFCFDISNGAFKSAEPSANSCVDAAGGMLHMTTCNPGAASQRFTAGADGSIRTGDGRCVSAHPSAATPKTNVWARPLSTGGWAIVFVNAGASAVDMTCDSKCLQTVGVAAGKSISAKDLWSGATSTVDPSVGLVVKGVAANGGSSMFTLHQ